MPPLREPVDERERPLEADEREDLLLPLLLPPDLDDEDRPDVLREPLLELPERELVERDEPEPVEPELAFFDEALRLPEPELLLRLDDAERPDDEPPDDERPDAERPDFDVDEPPEALRPDEELRDEPPFRGREDDEPLSDSVSVPSSTPRLRIIAAAVSAPAPRTSAARLPSIVRGCSFAYSRALASCSLT